MVEMGLRGLMEAAKEEARLRQVTSQPSFSRLIAGLIVWKRARL